jgi:hypothetical protein
VRMARSLPRRLLRSAPWEGTPARIWTEVEISTQESSQRWLKAYIPPPPTTPASGARTCERYGDPSASRCLPGSPTPSSSADGALRLLHWIARSQGRRPCCSIAHRSRSTRCAHSLISQPPSSRFLACLSPSVTRLALPGGFDLRCLLSCPRYPNLFAAPQLIFGFTLLLSRVF